MTIRPDIPLLIGQSGPVAGQRWPLSRDSFTIGRDAGCDVIVADRQVSRVHARLDRTAEGFVVEDLASKNGTHVNGVALEHRHRLQDGDVIQIALVARLVFVGSEATLPLPAGVTLMPAAAAGGGRLRLDPASRRLWIGERELDPPLSVPQFRFLELLFSRAGEVLGREQVVSIVWPDVASAGVSEQAVDALVRRLRDRLAELDPDHQYVATVRGHGFRLDNPPA